MMCNFLGGGKLHVFKPYLAFYFQHRSDEARSHTMSDRQTDRQFVPWYAIAMGQISLQKHLALTITYEGYLFTA